MNKLVVGQKLWLVETDFRNKQQEPEEVTISKVGSKYFELEGHHRMRFETESLKEYIKDYTTNSRCYLSLQDFNDEKELYKINRELGHFFSYSNRLSLEELRKIKAIINEHPTETI